MRYEQRRVLLPKGVPASDELALELRKRNRAGRRELLKKHRAELRNVARGTKDGE